MRRPWLAALPALVLAVMAVWEIVVTVRADAGVPSDRAWAAAAAHVRERHQAGDLIVFAPGWIDPVGRLHLGDLLPIDTLARMDAARFATIWEFAIRGARHPDVAGLTPTDVADFDGVVVRRFERTPVVVTADLAAMLPTAKVTGGRAARVLAEVDFAPRRCVQVVPAPDQTVRLVFPSVALGTALVGYAGLADVFKRREVTAPARLVVTIGDARVEARLSNTSGWSRFELPTTPGTAEVTVEITAVGAGARDRQVCFAAEARQ